MSTFEPIAHRPLSPAEERSLLDDLAAQETALLEKLDPAAAATARRREDRTRRLAALRGEIDAAARIDEAVDAAWKRIDQLRWRLALSAADQLRFQLRRRSYGSIDQGELHQAGMLGLYRAACRFDPERTVRFGTYARFWIRAAMNDLVGELEHAMRLPRSARRDMRALSSDERRGSHKRQGVLQAVRDCVSIDATREDGRPWAELVAAPEDAPVDRIDRTRQLRRLQEVRTSGVLNARHQHILRRRFRDGRVPPYRVIGEELSISGERVRQLEKQALRRMRERMAS
ncbi:MAG: sigma-70 family RNA polymerase sigma factor [Alphaproteobacteria bacterium]|nr:sigma-70 family RNA polymerase sigma factor [Alphaproteobacteria bacterium]